jgi:hypothetical protein
MMNRENTGKGYRQHHDKACQRARQSDIEEGAPRRNRRFHADECAKGPRPKHRRLRDEKRQRRVNAVITTKKIVTGFMRGQNCEQRSGKLQSLTQEFWVSEGITNYLDDCRHINPGEEDNGSG